VNPLLFLALFTSNVVIEIERIDQNQMTITQLHKRVLVYLIIQKSYIHFPPAIEEDEEEYNKEDEEIKEIERFFSREE
jgi:hypothetical protein